MIAAWGLCLRGTQSIVSPNDFFKLNDYHYRLPQWRIFRAFTRVPAGRTPGTPPAVPRLKSPQNPLFAARAFLPDKNQLVRGKRPTLYVTVLLGSLPMKSLIFVGKNNRSRLSLS